MKKQILIVNHALELGGAERSLIGLLSALDSEEYDIDLFLLRHEGELLKEVPVYINLLPSIPAYTVLARPMIDTLKEGHILLTVARLVGKFLAKQYDKRMQYSESGVALEYSHKYTAPLMPMIQPEKEYDLAISFLTPHYFVVDKVKAKKKIAWIHTDYSLVQVNRESELKMWNQYDVIASISEKVTESFLQNFPTLENKVQVIENILPEAYIRSLSNVEIDESEMKENGINLLSIGRYCHAKNFDNVPEICKHLVNKGMDVYWYIIGFGSGEELIKNKIKEFGMEERVILLGKKENPYPYIKNCDLYVQPSRYEGKCVAVREAQMLGKPVVITDYPTSKSQLEVGVDGIIVPMENQLCAYGIAELLNDSEKMNELSENCKKRDYSNSSEVEKIYQLME